MSPSIVDPPVRLVVVTGSGRSGTSTVAGTLKRLGLYVPLPEQPADETNPKGFFEPRWVVDFHKRLLDSVPVRTNDARPRAAADMREVGASPDVREELRSWLAQQVVTVGPGGQLVVKDPRTFWLHELWSDVADDLGVELAYLTMLRHPAEVVQSRDTYLTDKTEEFRRMRQTGNLAGWVNSAYETESATRARPRTFVRYVDLLTDWRSTMTQVEAHLGITFDIDLAAQEPHDVDEFIDVTLRRSCVTWDDVDTIPDLRDQARLAWDACNALVDAPYDPKAIGTLQEVHDRYVQLHQYAQGIALDHTNVTTALERRALRRQMRLEHKNLRRRLDRRREQVRHLEKELAALSRTPTRSRMPWRRWQEGR